MSRSVLTMRCPKCGHEFAVKEDSSLGRKLLRLGVLSGGGFLVGGPLGSLIGVLGSTGWNILDGTCVCPKCGERLDRPTAQ